MIDLWHSPGGESFLRKIYMIYHVLKPDFVE